MEKEFVSVTCEKDVDPFKRNFFEMQDKGETLAKAYVWLSPDQKKAFKKVVL